MREQMITIRQRTELDSLNAVEFCDWQQSVNSYDLLTSAIKEATGAYQNWLDKQAQQNLGYV